jgi:hypothetical protein
MSTNKKCDFAVRSERRVRGATAYSANIAFDKPAMLLAGFSHVVWHCFAFVARGYAAIGAYQTTSGLAFFLILG